MTISIHGVTKEFNGFTALRGIDFEIRTGELVALLGPSGSGKTTLLRIIAGLEWPDRGEIHLGGQDASLHSVRDRRVGFVFQHYALFRHMSVFENIAFGLRVRDRATRPDEADIRERVMTLLTAAARETNAAVVLVTHEVRVAAYSDREVVVRDGRTRELEVAA